VTQDQEPLTIVGIREAQVNQQENGIGSSEDFAETKL
jgi:hypothetical protein